jgi:hypothetical protein
MDYSKRRVVAEWGRHCVTKKGHWRIVLIDTAPNSTEYALEVAHIDAMGERSWMATEAYEDAIGALAHSLAYGEVRLSRPNDDDESLLRDFTSAQLFMMALQLNLFDGDRHKESEFLLLDEGSRLDRVTKEAKRQGVSIGQLIDGLPHLPRRQR